ncbi:LEF-4 [Adoxophyes orana nucleopolyhedrovirus]|uniref:LEF-4 n=1 Tax=Adoxophyes orana nucleopolyhedrovirus TaxID=542343 RepID=UPI0001829C10|nr:LEF-4 [Adoxophyes orana nucleopolyhedrovirus]ACF05357.1 LEF-4 [Adoxophyes orana nucleopolyhedrovirus]
MAIDSTRIVENEISYTINFSQDLIYLIFESYISKECEFVEKYYDIIDENKIRTRIHQDGKIYSHLKTVESMYKTVICHDDILLPLVCRTSIEDASYSASKNFDKLVECRLYNTKNKEPIEIKFEQIYYNKNLNDTFDSLMGTKQIILLNLLKNNNETIGKNSHLGSDEILANLRIEFEHPESGPSKEILQQMCLLILRMDQIGRYQNISPMIPYTTMQNSIIYRKFEQEKLIYNSKDVTNVCRWALKLDGVRGRGLFTSNFCIIFMDDMQMFSGHVPTIFSLNNVVAFQCELIDGNCIYITDLLHVFKYVYNNKTQYECSQDGYNIEPLNAVNVINFLHDKYKNEEIVIKTRDNKRITIKFQKFFDKPLPLNKITYNTVATDGYVVLDTSMSYVKYKHVKTVELEYNDTAKVFLTLDGSLDNYKIDSKIKLEHGNIYETVIVNDVITVIKSRPDRLVPQTL